MFQVCHIVCQSAWGKMSSKVVEMGSETQQERQWTLAHDQLSWTKPENPSMLANIPEAENTTDNIVTYMEYVDIEHPRIKLEDGSFDPQTE